MIKLFFVKELLLAIILLALLIFVVNPFELWMPPAIIMMSTAGILVVFSLFAIFIWKEKSLDEREEYHRMLAGRLSFLAGSGILTLAIAIQSFSHMLDPWLVVALGGMILTKIASLVYAQMKK